MSSEKIGEGITQGVPPTDYLFTEYPTKFGPDRVMVSRGTADSMKINPTNAAAIGDEIRKSWTHGGLPDKLFSTVFVAPGGFVLTPIALTVIAGAKSLWHLGEGLTNGRLLEMIDHIGGDMHQPVRFIVNLIDGILGNRARRTGSF